MKWNKTALSAVIAAVACSAWIGAAPALAKDPVMKRVGSPVLSAAEKQAQFDAWYEAAAPKIAKRNALISSILSNVSADVAKLSDPAGSLRGLGQMLHLADQETLDTIASEKSLEVVETYLVKAAREDGMSPTKVSTKAALGDGVNLVFVPRDPCRIADSRGSTAGILQSGIVRNYFNFGASGQGGTSTCNVGAGPQPGMTSGTSGALALTLTVTDTTALGWLVVRPFGSSSQTSVVNWTGAGQTIANSTVVVTQGGAADFQAIVNGGGSAHLIIDLLGFYLRAEPAALDCVSGTVGNGTTGTNPALETVASSACATGYTVVGGSCQEDDDAILVDATVSGNSWFCAYIPRAATATNFSATARCCRTPGTTAGRF